ncbi:MAG: 16S rRNA (cytosine(1402)-N(4))-methyltransferase RsmH [Candidatus Nealsonbacteria bacterium]|nr:16S rRNA (cytosine(1402)-N(4))-methyltransferase RsmH [Candidatus Nealsonbacteria bacterium]
MHVPVLQKEIIDFLSPKPGENLIDCTLGEGGHSLIILERILPEGKILGIDWDLEMINNFQERIKEDREKKDNFILVCDNFANLKKIVEKNNFKPDLILLDLGFSSWHLENSKKGFSFQKQETLDMRYNSGGSGLQASDVVNKFSQSEIEKILREYGEERFAKKIASRIVKERDGSPIESTTDLVGIIEKATPLWYQKRKIHFATLTFQALRIFVNKEIENLETVLAESMEVLNPKGRLAIISFHSLEDRAVKNFFKEKERQEIIKILTKKPVIPGEQELKINPRSRSAKLRVAEKKN